MIDANRNRTTKRVVMLSYPRSGSGLMFNILSDIIDEKFTVKRIGCVSYSPACNTVPCSCDPPAFLTKNHDFDNTVEIKADINYIVIIRKDKIANIEAYCRFKKLLQTENMTATRNIDLNVVDIDEAFIKKQDEYWQRFYNKWVTTKYKNVWVVYTEDIISAPATIIDKLYELLEMDKNNKSEYEKYLDKLISRSKFKEDKKEQIYYTIKGLTDSL